MIGESIGNLERWIKGHFHVGLIICIFLTAACDRASDNERQTEEATASGASTSEQKDIVWPTHGDLIYVSNEDSGDISIISTATHQVVATLDVGRRPRGIKISNSGDRVFVALSGSPKCPPTLPDEECAKLETDKSHDGIAIVDVRNGKLDRVLPGGSDPEQFDLSKDGRRLFVSNEDSNQTTIVDIDSSEVIRTIDVGREPEGVRVSPDGKLVYITAETDHNVTVMDSITGAIIASIKVGLRPRDAIFSPDGSRAYVSSELGHSIAVIDVAGHEVLSTIALDETAKPVGMVIRSDGKRLYVANGRGKTVSEIDLDTLQILRSVEVGPRSWGIALGTDERFLYTANGPSDDVSVIDVESMAVIARIKVGETPWGLVIGPVPQQL